jgi:pyruvate dehydrogenase E1 component
MLLDDGVYASVVNCVSPDRIYRQWQGAVHSGQRFRSPQTTSAPVVTVLDGHPAALAWVGSMLGVAAWPLGVTHYGESGDIQNLYQAAQIDADAITNACFAALDSPAARSN